MNKAKQEEELSIQGKRATREDRRIETAKAKTPKLSTRLNTFKVNKDAIIKALADAGHRESALLLKNWDEMDINAEEMQKSLSKSNAIKPGGVNIYDVAANVERKNKRTGMEAPDAGKNVAVQPYTTSGSSMQAAHEAATAKEQKKKTKLSTKTMTDFTPEQIAEMEEKYGKKNG